MKSGSDEDNILGFSNFNLGMKKEHVSYLEQTLQL